MAMTVVRLLLDVYDHRGTVTVFKDVQLSFIPRQGERFRIAPSLLCSVEEVVGNVEGWVEVKLRLRNVSVPDASQLVAHLVNQDGWQPLADGRG